MEHSVIFFDIDGTILTDENTIPLSTVRAIGRAQANGHKCIINTGRPFSHIEPSVKALGFDGYICSCGQFLLLEDQVLLQEQFPPALCREIIQQLRLTQLDVIFEGEQGIWTDAARPTPANIRAALARFEQRGFTPYQNIDRADFCFDKLCVWTNERSDWAGFRAFIEAHCSIIDRGGGLFELVKLGCTKETGIRQVIRHLGCALEQCYAIGDSSNDLPMLHCVPHSIAMGDAPDHVKAQVEYVTDSIHSDGLAKALEHYGLA